MSSRTPESVLFVSQHFHPEPIGSAPYISDMAEFLARRGTRVRVFTCRPHYPRDAATPAYRNGAHDRETWRGIEVARVPAQADARGGTLGRIGGEFRFLLRGLAAIATGRLRRAPIVVSLCPSILTVLLGTFATRSGGHHVAVVHDIQSGLASGLGMVGSEGRVVGLMRWLEKVVLNRTDKVLVLSHAMRQRLQRQGVTAPIEILPIWVDTQSICPRPPDPARAACPTVLYSGNLGKKQALDQVLDVAAALKQRGRALNIVLRGSGGMAGSLVREAAERQLDNVRFAPLVEREKLAEGLAEGDIHLVPQDGKIADFAVPSKVFAIMAAGRPFVAASPPGTLLWDLQERSKAFVCVPSGDTGALTAAIERLAAKPEERASLGRNGRAYAVEQHDTHAVLERFVVHLQPARV